MKLLAAGGEPCWYSSVLHRRLDAFEGQILYERREEEESRTDEMTINHPCTSPGIKGPGIILLSLEKKLLSLNCFILLQENNARDAENSPGIIFANLYFWQRRRGMGQLFPQFSA